VLTALVERLAGAAILLLVSYRPGYRLPWLDKSYVTQVALAPLTSADSRQVAQANLGPTPIAEPLVPAIVAKGEGNPFFLEELARAVMHHGAQWPTSEVPETVQAVLAARIDQLPLPSKRLLQVAAVIGKDVPLPLLQAVGGLPEEVLDQQFAQLQAREFLYELFVESTPAYTFTHALTQEVAYGSLLQERRRALHARIVEAIERFSPDRLAEQVERLTHQALQGEVWDKAVTYCRQAGLKAVARSAYREAVASFEQAVVALQHLPQSRSTCEQAIDLGSTCEDRSCR
jgi:predicted ATPase